MTASSSSGSVTKRSWSPTMVESIIDSLKEYKSLCEFNATDVNADKVKLYEKVRQMMAGKYASELLWTSRENSRRETSEGNVQRRV